jgi:hypothetical protein
MIGSLVEEFTSRLSEVVERQVIERARAAVESALGGRKPGRPPKLVTLAVVGRKVRRKGPVQLCPVPGCKNPAAPVFGMVCADHKGVPRAKIKKYREARKAKKLSVQAVTTPKGRTKKVALKTKGKKTRRARRAKKPALKMTKAKRRTKKVASPGPVAAATPPATAAA